MKLKHLLFIFSVVLICSCSKLEPDKSYDSDISALAGLDWGNETVYAIGHKNPDTDATCSAICYAYLMRQLGYDVEARVPGRINNETVFVLDYFNTDIPDIMDDATGKRLILTDHSEISQAVSGIEMARILQIIDHHGLGSIMESSPLFIKTMPVGSSCTVIYSSYKDYEVDILPTYAGLMLSALLSDTNNLTSSTTTQLDKDAYQELVAIVGISDVDLYYHEMREAAAAYHGLNDMEIFISDYKDYNDLSGHAIGVSCVNSKNDNHDALCSRMLAIMPQVIEDKKRDMVFALIGNVESEYTDILYYGEGAKDAAESAFGVSTEGRIRVSGLMSRKKDFIPAIADALK